jgi:hypothetical protein
LLQTAKYNSPGAREQGVKVRLRKGDRMVYR